MKVSSQIDNDYHSYNEIKYFAVREKAEILVQVEKLTQFKDELTEQVSELHGHLEQEKSKVHQLQDEIKRLQQAKAVTARKRSSDSMTK